jgi:leucyl-tRNA synthetase
MSRSRPEHPLAQRAAESNPRSSGFIAECRRAAVAEAAIETAEKRGMYTGIDAIHPVTGDKVPVWVANFVLMGYGTGAVMAVPAHDERDHEFATKYGLPIKQVVKPADGSAIDVLQAAYVEHGILVNSGQFDGLDFRGAFDAIAGLFEVAGSGRRKVNFRLRDWGVSRQRYWGCPIPVIYCAKCDAVPVPEDQLPVVLPEDVQFMGTGSPIKADPEWRKTTCPQCGGPAERETDTFDTFMESSWYYARYTSPGATGLVDERANHWLPVDQYIGGIEHAILHLLYFRFFHKLMRDEGLVRSDEPATRLLCQGMVVAETFFREKADGSKDWINPADVDIETDERAKVIGAKLRSDGLPVQIGPTEKMSKSKNNGVDPQVLVDKFGADTVRLYSMFASPPEMSLEWSENGVEGMARFVRKLWREVRAHVAAGPVAKLDAATLDVPQKALRRKLHETIDKVGDDYARRYTFNTAIAAVMELMNALGKLEGDAPNVRALRQEALEAVVLLLNPITPHLSHALRQELGHGETLVEDVPFPKADPAALTKDVLTLAVQVNGKLRGTIDVATTADKDSIIAQALADATVQKFIAGLAVKKTIVVPGKIVNIVVG